MNWHGKTSPWRLSEFDSLVAITTDTDVKELALALTGAPIDDYDRLRIVEVARRP
jgi:hypothetical protein